MFNVHPDSNRDNGQCSSEMLRSGWLIIDRIDRNNFKKRLNGRFLYNRNNFCYVYCCNTLPLPSRLIMNINSLKRLLRIKTLQLEMAIQSGKSHEELLVLYKELKNLQYELLQAKLTEEILPDEEVA